MSTDSAAALVAAIIMGIIAALIWFGMYALASYRCEERWQGNSRVQAVEYTFSAQCRIKIDGQWLPENSYRLTE